MNKQLSWYQISQSYSGHWVELVDFEWDWDSAYPTKAKIRHASSDRASLMSKIKSDVEQENSVVIFVENTHSLVGPLSENYTPQVTL